MTPRTSTPENGLIANLPPTRAGLWTAITTTEDFARRLAGACHGEESTRVDSVADACAQAAQTLSVSAPLALHATSGQPGAQPPDPCDGWPLLRDPGWPLLRDLVSGCIDLAVDLLGNEDEPLDPVEVLAVTRAVTALCVARSLVTAGVA